MLIINNLFAGYSKINPILKGINLNIEEGEIIGIFGRNGSGKSTLAKAICGFVPYLAGSITIDGEQILGQPPFKISQMGVGFFQQGGKVFNNLSVFENIQFACRERNESVMKKKIFDVLGWFDILNKPERLKLKASYLSGGEKHQLALAMIMIQQPRLLILDEPSASLSSKNQQLLYDLIRKTQKETNATMLLIEQNKNFQIRLTNKNYKIGIDGLNNIE